MNPSFQIESIFNIHGKGYFLALRSLNDQINFRLTDYSTIEGLRIENYVETPRLVNGLGHQRYDIFVFKLANAIDAVKLNEGQAVMLKENGLDDYWNDYLKLYKEFESWDVKPIKYIVRHICGTNYSKRLYPGVSIMRLLISKPRNGKLNFTNTLKIDYNQDKIRQLIRFIYTENGRQKYFEECQASEGVDTFEAFMKWRKW